MNSVVRQMWEQNTDVVMVDTGNSYEGLCEYVGGKYISYAEEHPITMNPFAIKREELNIEKIGFLKNLIMLIWKGTQGIVTKTEDRLIEQVIKEYFMYSAIIGEAIAFHASSITSTLRFFLILIFWMNTSMMISVTRGNRRGSSLMESISNTMKVSSNSLVSRFSFSVTS